MTKLERKLGENGGKKKRNVVESYKKDNLFEEGSVRHMSERLDKDTHANIH